MKLPQLAAVFLTLGVGIAGVMAAEASAERARVVVPPTNATAMALRVASDGQRLAGVDAERVPALVRRLIADGADWRGFHIFAGSQALLAGRYEGEGEATVTITGIRTITTTRTARSSTRCSSACAHWRRC